MAKLGMAKEEGYYYLVYQSKFNSRPKPIDRSKFPLEELARQLDLKCEDRNNHDFVKAHQVLAVLLYRNLGREKATEIMWQIAEMGGLDSMTDNWNSDGFDLAYPEYFKSGHWNYDWKLED